MLDSAALEPLSFSAVSASEAALSTEVFASASPWWQRVVVAAAFVIVTPIIVTGLLFMAFLLAPVCVVTAPIIAFTLFWPGRPDRPARHRVAHARTRLMHA